MQNRDGKLEIKLGNRQIDDPSATPFQTLKPGEYLELKVIDNGFGIAPEIVEKIFEPYFTTKPKGNGSGLGLATVHGIVKKLGGEILLESRRGCGSSFTILLPAMDYHASITDSLTELLKLPTGCEELLLVDDEKDIVELNRQVLEKLGYRISTCNDGDSALKMIRRNLQRFDLILTDMTMPGISGIELARKGLQLNPKLRFILGTGHSETVNREEALQLGIKEFYNKPLRTDSLAKLIRQVLDEGCQYND
jgi:CheY-like chemotaxis protein